MPKMKTLSAARKRFRVTGTGKIKRKKVGMRHLLSKHRSQKKRDLKRDAFLTGGQKKAVEFMLGTQI